MSIDIIGAGALGGFLFASLRANNNIRLLHTNYEPYCGTIKVNNSTIPNTYVERADSPLPILTIYAGYLHLYKPSKNAPVLLLSNGSIFLKMLKKEHCNYCGSFNYLAAHRLISERNNLCIAVDDVGTKAAQLVIDDYSLTTTLASSRYNTLYDPLGSSIFQKTLRTIAYALMATDSTGSHGPDLFNRRRTNRNELCDVLSELTIVDAQIERLTDIVYEVSNSLPCGFYPSVARPTSASRNEALYLLDLFREWISLRAVS